MPRHGRSLPLHRAAVAALLACAAAGAQAKPPETRCGWFLNPSPGNAWLIDRDGEWTIALQGGHQAEGDWPAPPSKSQWVAPEGDDRGYGYGCACMKVEADRAEKTILRIVSAQGKPLKQCRRDRALTEPRD